MIPDGDPPNPERFSPPGAIFPLFPAEASDPRHVAFSTMTRKIDTTAFFGSPGTPVASWALALSRRTVLRTGRLKDRVNAWSRQSRLRTVSLAVETVSEADRRCEFLCPSIGRARAAPKGTVRRGRRHARLPGESFPEGREDPFNEFIDGNEFGLPAGYDRRGPERERRRR